ncbi:MAG: hypothetical protein CMH62_03335 [Nanoarchaeota archaeon]|nr:hypothetical protein [Nanoarchaeota archaeon]|tara:strand:- start:1303 stop:1731 length:429 start_codon:yes stop_codon:yes gene_type:complete
MAYSIVSHWKRFASFLIDSILLNVIITKPLSSILENNIPQKITDLLTFDFKNLFLITLLISLINLSYWVILEYKIQQTIGGLIFNIYVKSQNNKLTFSQIFIRNLTKISSILLIIDVISIFTSKKRQRFTERFTKTITIENG